MNQFVASSRAGRRIILAVPLVLAHSPVDCQAEPFVFGGLVTAVTEMPESIAALDLNEDGHLDLVVVGLEEVVVLFGDGWGGFSVAQRLTGGDAGLAIADVTGDGVMDLVVGTTSGCEISLHAGLGGGVFAEREGIPTACGPATVVAADFNGDGVVDLATGNVQSQNISVLFGLGAGAFAAPTTIETAINSGVGAIAAFDIDDDGDTDLISAGGDSVTVHWNTGGAFPTQASFAAGLTPRSVQVGDVSNDGRPDIVVSNSATNRVSILRQFASGSFLPPQTISVGAAPERILLADMDDDGSLDLAVAHPSTIIEISNPNEAAPEGSIGLFGGEVRTYRNNGSGTFSEADRFFAGAWPRAFAVGDFTGDGRTDLATASRVLPATTIPFIMSDEEESGATDADAVGFVSLAPGRGDATFAGAERVLSAGASRIRLGDVDNDGDLDLFEGRDFGFLVRRNSGDGRFSVLVGGANTTGLPQLDPSFTLGRVDDDTRLDIVAATFEGIKIAFGNGSGFFSPFVTVDAAPFRSVTVADVNGDQILDIIGGAVREQASDRAVVLLGNGFGGFTRVDEVAIPADPFAVIAADFNGDSVPDAAFACRDSKQIAVVLLAPDGSVMSTQTIPIPGLAYGVRAADFNQDGHLDLVAASFDPAGGAIVLINDGTGQFVFEQQIGSFSDVPDVEARDFDFDGWPDVLVPDGERDIVHVYLNDQAGGFIHAGAFVTGDYPRSIAAGDVNGDDRIDVVVSARQSDVNNPGPQTFSAVMSHFNERVGPAVVGDLTGEGIVGSADLTELLRQWGACPAKGNCAADLNGDGVVNGLDLALLLANWS